MLVLQGPGKIDVDYGPVSLQVLARVGGLPHSAAARAAAEAAVSALTRLSSLTSVAFRPALSLTDDERWPHVLQLMVEAARLTGDPSLTPMSAVAGSIAEVSMEAALDAGAGTVVVENGGDIALSVETGDTVSIGVARSVVDRTVGHTLTLSGPTDIRGVCTSGLGGRSFTRGIADAAVALASSASRADACATVMANATFVDTPSVEQVPAIALDPNTDIPDLPVTVNVGHLDEATVLEALLSAEATARSFVARGLIMAGLITVQGRTVTVGEKREALFAPCSTGKSGPGRDFSRSGLP